MVWVPSAYINQIRHKIKPSRTNPYSRADLRVEPNFETWEEARDWIVKERLRQAQRARTELERATHSYDRALRMAKPAAALKPKPAK